MVIFLRQFSGWLTKFKPKSLHVFWDAPRDTVWRRRIMPTYKNRSSSAYIENLGEILSANTQIARLFFDVMNVRQYDKDNMEADDLIYSAATVLHPHRSMIVSTDSDLTQIPFMLSSSQVYDPHKAIIVDTPSYHPAYMKAISGDKADSIKGYVGIGIKRGSTLMEDEMKLQVFLDERGRERFNLNLLVTDLSLNPKLLANRIYVKKIMGRPVVFDKEKIGDLVKSYKIVGLDSEYADLIPPFQRLS
jgi:5'-3' exonuclease